MAGLLKLAATGVALCSFGFSTPAAPQGYPNQPVRIIVSIPAGGVQDALARAIGKELSEKLKQPFVIENRPGANTTIAARIVAEAPADGYTLLIASDPTLTMSPYLYKKLPYDPINGFVPISHWINMYQHLYVNADLPAKSFPEFLRYAKANPNKVNYGSFGYGSNPHLAAEDLRRNTGIDIFHIPFKGNADSLPALASNQIQMMISSLGLALPLIQANKIRAIAVSGDKRVPQIPEVPTFAELGYPQVRSYIWLGMVAPKGTPPTVVNLLAEHTNNYIRSAAFRQLAARFMLDPIGSSPEEFAKFLTADRARYKTAIAASKIEPVDQ